MVCMQYSTMFQNYLLCIGNIITYVEKTSISEDTCPKLNTNNTKNEKYKKTQQKDVAKHRKSIEKQHHQDTHT